MLRILHFTGSQSAPLLPRSLLSLKRGLCHSCGIKINLSSTQSCRPRQIPSKIQELPVITFFQGRPFTSLSNNTRDLQGLKQNWPGASFSQCFVRSLSTRLSNIKQHHQLRFGRTTFLHGTQSLELSWSLKNTGIFLVQTRNIARNSKHEQGNKTGLIYICAIFIFMIGMSYLGVPLYRMFCQASGLGGQAVKGHDTSKIETMEPVKERIIKVRFNADTASSMQWNFRPQQAEVNLVPGETALAFYTAKNPTDKPIIGISTYNVVPFEAGQYFNKIQCFCFEEQRLNPHEEVDMPVFFYIDPEFVTDPKLETTDRITLSYTFFEAKDGMSVPLPGYIKATQ